MDLMQETLFLSEIVFQAQIAKRAGEELKATKNSYDKIDVWKSLQSILIAAANVSKILWSSRFSSRSERLRNMLNVDDDNILRDRKFRNHFEHYDERIEEWFESQSSAVYTDLSMNPSLRTLDGMPPRDHRGYNSFNNTLLFRGELLDIAAVLKALEELENSCSRYVLT